MPMLFNTWPAPRGPHDRSPLARHKRASGATGQFLSAGALSGAKKCVLYGH